VITAGAVLLALASIFPLYLWLLSDGQGLPLWPVFAGFNGITAALPMVQSPKSLDAFTSGDVLVGGLTYTGFLVLGTVVWLAATPRLSRVPQQLFMISGRHTTRVLFCFVGLGIFYYLNAYFWWVPLPGNTYQIARGICVSLNTMGVFVLFFYLGRGMLTTWEAWVTVVLSVLSAMFMATTLILNTAIVPVGLGFLGYVLGSGKIPWKSLAAIFVAVSILHAGKFAMRESYWGGTGSYSPLELFGFYKQWATYGVEELGGVAGAAKVKSEDDREVTSVFERSGTLHMLLRVQKMSPQEVPFLNGITYEGIPKLLVPRFISSDKGIAHAGNIMLTVNYGLQSAEVAMGGTSIMWGLVTEAYANFSYLGVAALAVVLALFYAYMGALTVGVPLTSLRFVLGLLVMGAAIKADTMALFVTQQFQGVVAVAFAALFIMRRQANPFAPLNHDNGDASMQVERSSPQRMANDGRRAVGPTKWGGFKPPKWAPLSHRKAYELATARRKAEAATDVVDEKNVDEGKAQRPRQVAVPIQPYYYRSRKA